MISRIFDLSNCYKLLLTTFLGSVDGVKNRKIAFYPIKSVHEWGKKKARVLPQKKKFGFYPIDFTLFFEMDGVFCFGWERLEILHFDPWGKKPKKIAFYPKKMVHEVLT